MLVFSLLFLTAAWLLTKKLGSVGFILANCVNMTLRIIHRYMMMMMMIMMMTLTMMMTMTTTTDN
jgi:hypothetical protein